MLRKVKVYNQNSCYVGGFALPTVLIASTVMLLVLTSALLGVSGITSSLTKSQYDRSAQLAAESGLAMAKACLVANNYEATWTNTQPLRPNTDCFGAVLSGKSPYIHSSSTEQSTFTIPLPTTLANGVQRVVVNASLDRLRVSTQTIWVSYSRSIFSTISAQTTFSTVAFGYAFNKGVFFGLVGPQGAVSTVGYNGDGQLGNGNTTNAALPQAFKLPNGVSASQLYASFLSNGYNLFAKTSDGKLYGAGANSDGQLGNGTTTTAQTTPVPFQLPAGVSPLFASAGWLFTFVLGSDYSIYSAGACVEGILGYGYSIPSCTSQPTPRRVALPAVNMNDPNTLPVTSSTYTQATNLTGDGFNAFVVMQGGHVYGWGRGDNGQLGNGSDIDAASPVRFGTLGDSGKSKGQQVAFDGFTTWVLDDAGSVWSSGMNTFGQLGTPTQLRTTTGLCVDNANNNAAPGQRVRLWSCDPSATPAQALHFDTDGAIKFYPNASTTLCLDNYGGLAGNGNAIQTYSCNGTGSQQWQMRDDGRIVNSGTSMCLDNTNNSSAPGSLLQLWTCDTSSPAQVWSFPIVNTTVSKVILPSGHGKALRLSTDQYTLFCLMEDGTVWGIGAGGNGVIGNGVNRSYNPAFQQFKFPDGRKATDLYATNDAPSGIGNTYVVLDDGSVFGAGSNTNGQLGNGTTSTIVSTPVRMNLPAGVRAKSVQAGYGTAVILTDQGRIYTVGNNRQGQLGDGTTNDNSTPAAHTYLNVRPIMLY